MKSHTQAPLELRLPLVSNCPSCGKPLFQVEKQLSAGYAPELRLFQHDPSVGCTFKWYRITTPVSGVNP